MDPTCKRNESDSVNSIALAQQKIISIAQYFQSIERIESKKDVESVNKNLMELLEWLPGPVTPEQLLRMDQSLYVDWYSIARNEYSMILESILKIVDHDWLGQQEDQNTGFKLLAQLFTIDHNYELCFERVSALVTFKRLSMYPALVNILEQIVASESFLFSLIVDISHKQTLSAVEESNLENRKQRIIQLLASTPNIVANQLKGQIADAFVPQSYCAHILIAILKAIHFVSTAKMVFKTDCFDTSFISRFIGRILIDFNSERTSTAIPKLIDLLEIWSMQNEYHRKHIQNVLLFLNRNAIEVISEYLLESNKINYILGKAFKQSADWRYCLATKLPLLTYSKSDRMIINLVRYLSHVSDRDEELYNVFIDVLKLWSSTTTISSQSVDHHLYLTKFVIISATMLTLNCTENRSSEIQKTIHRGVMNHIKSLHSMVRAMGMITAELLCNQFNNINEDDKLKFEYDTFSEDIKQMVRHLQDLSCLNLDEYDSDAASLNEDTILNDLCSIASKSRLPFECTTQNRMPRKASTSIVTTEIESHSISQPVISKSNTRNSLDEDDLDSDDDDLEPYDMSNDTSDKAEKAPKYLIDLRENLLETDDPDVFQISLEVCEELILQKMPNEDVRLGLDLLQILIGLKRKFYMENFHALRFAGCVAICCCFPKDCAEYLCTEIHSEAGRYAVTTKTMMLDILSQTAHSLSKITINKKEIKEDKVQSTTMPKKLVNFRNETKSLENSRKIIWERIESKTRRFATKTPHPFMNAQKNRFADVAGYFFFPLLYGFGKQQLMFTSTTNALKHDTDNILLLSFLHTISVVTIASQNCLIVSKFGPEIFGLSSVLRYHTEPRVRLGVLQMLASAFMVIPKSELVMYCYNEICEVRLWLEQVLSTNIIRGETNSECREVAKHVMSFCLDTLN